MVAICDKHVGYSIGSILNLISINGGVSAFFDVSLYASAPYVKSSKP
jgi:hypothetical protein